MHIAKMNFFFAASALLLAGASLVSAQGHCPPVYPHCQMLNRPNPNWQVGLDHARGGGVVAHGQAGGSLGGGASGNVNGHRTFGGPNNGAQSVGGGLNYNHPSGLHGGVDVTHSKGHGTSYSGSVGGSTKVGPGTLSVGGGVNGGPRGRPEANVGAKYSIP